VAQESGAGEGLDGLGTEPQAEASGDDSGLFGDDTGADAGSERDGSYPQAYTARPQTLPKGTVRADLSFLVFKPAFGGFDFDATTVLQVGGGFGVLDDLEVGIGTERLGMRRVAGTGLVPLALSPDFEFGLITPYGRYRFLSNDVVQVSADLSFFLPTASVDGFLFPNFILGVALPVRITPMERLSIDTGIDAQFRFYDGGDFVDLYEIPGRTAFNITEMFFVEALPTLQIGQEFGPRVDNSYFFAFGFGVGAGASIPVGELGIIDAGVQFELPFLGVAGSEVLDGTEPEAWLLTFVGRWYIDVLDPA
jgi:hypothetical protein